MCLMPGLGRFTCADVANSARNTPAATTNRPTRARRLKNPSGEMDLFNFTQADPELHNSGAQQLVFSGEQILNEIVTALIGVARGAGEMMIDSHAR